MLFSVWKGYCRSRIKYLLLLVVWSVILGVVFALYRLPVYAVWYGGFLCVWAMGLFFLIDFMRYFKKYKLLWEMRNNITTGVSDFPQPSGLLEQQYQELITILYDYGHQQQTQSNRARSELLDYYTVWAHQIKTPISAMYLLLQSEKTPQRKEMTLELFKIEKYVEMVLQFLRLESLSSDLVLQQYDLTELVKQAVREYSLFFIQKKIKLVFEALDTQVMTDKKWLVFVLEQLLSNALKYTPVGGSITIGMDREKKKTLVIEDTGMGIQKEDLPRIFERGFTGFNGRMETKSTGIGLYLCKKILTRLSYKIEIQSQPGQGTKVFLNLDTVETLFE